MTQGRPFAALIEFIGRAFGKDVGMAADARPLALGDKVQDRITGFEGIATGVADYITGCRQILVTPKAASDGKYIDACWLDVDRLVVLEENVVTMANRQKDGGPQSAPSKR